MKADCHRYAKPCRHLVTDASWRHSVGNKRSHAAYLKQSDIFLTATFYLLTHCSRMSFFWFLSNLFIDFSSLLSTSIHPRFDALIKMSWPTDFLSDLHEIPFEISCTPWQCVLVLEDQLTTHVWNVGFNCRSNRRGKGRPVTPPVLGRYRALPPSVMVAGSCWMITLLMDVLGFECQRE